MQAIRSIDEIPSVGGEVGAARYRGEHELGVEIPAARTALREGAPARLCTHMPSIRGHATNVER